MSVEHHQVSVLVADDHTVLRQSISEMLERSKNIEVVGQAGDGSEAVCIAEKAQPDVVLLDVEMPILEVQEVIEQIIESSPSSKIVILTMYDDYGLMRELLALGASAYLVKTVSSEELVYTVESVASGEDRVTLSLSREAFVQASEQGDQRSLSERELEILLYAARGMSNAQVGSLLYLTEGTVKRHLHNIYTKLEVASRGEATRKALSKGWITARDITSSGDP